jgi:hypothetical protein
MENKTAVEWLIEQIKDDQFKKVKTDLQWSKIFEQAKEMEKQQIMYAFNSGENSDDYFFPSLKLKECEVYYNETYKSKQDEI